MSKCRKRIVLEKTDLIYPEKVDHIVLYLTNIKETYVDFVCLKYSMWDNKSRPLKANRDIFLSGYVKWDGCSEFHGIDTHLCGKTDWELFERNIPRIFKACAENIEKYDPQIGGLV